MVGIAGLVLGVLRDYEFWRVFLTLPPAPLVLRALSCCILLSGSGG